MEVVKLGKKGQVTIPRGVLRAVGLSGEAVLAAEATADGAILLRQAAVVPIEIYSEKRIHEFEKASRVPQATVAKVRKLTGRR